MSAGRPRHAFTLRLRATSPISAGQRDAYTQAGTECLLVGSPRAASVDELEEHMARSAAALLQSR